MILPAGSWCDLTVLPDGQVVWVVLSGATVTAYVHGTDVLWSVTLPQPFLHLRAASDELGSILAIGQGEDDDHAWATIDGGEAIDLGPTFGVSPVDVEGEPRGWTIYVVRPGVLEQWLVSPALVSRQLVNSRPTDTTQGVLEPGILCDDYRYVPGPPPDCQVVLPQLVGSVWIGQHVTRDECWRATDLQGQTATVYRSTRPGTAQPPRAVQTPDGRYHICGYTPEGAVYFSLDAIPWGNETATYSRRPSDVPRQREFKHLDYYYDHGKYGDFAPACNGTVIDVSFWDVNKQRPHDASQRLQAAIRQAGAGFIAGNSYDAARPVWDLVEGVWLDEYGTPQQMRVAAAEARGEVAMRGLSPKPVIATIMPYQAADPAYRGVADWVACEIYLDAPSSTPEQTEADWLARARVVTAIHRVTPTILIVQSYDRNNPVWKTPHGQQCLEAIQYAASVALADVAGLWWFAYGRPGGVTTYPRLEAWQAATVAGIPERHSASLSPSSSASPSVSPSASVSPSSSEPEEPMPKFIFANPDWKVALAARLQARWDALAADPRSRIFGQPWTADSAHTLDMGTQYQNGLYRETNWGARHPTIRDHELLTREIEAETHARKGPDVPLPDYPSLPGDS